MKTRKSLWVGLLILSLTGTVFADLVAHYEFEGTPNDSSGNGLHGTLLGGAIIVVDDSRGQVLSLKGNGDAMNCGNDTLFRLTEELTLATWVKFDSVPADWTGIITKGETAWGLSTVFRQLRSHFSITAPQSFHFVDGDASLVDGRWHHLCGTYDGENLRLFVDGFEDSQSMVPYEGPLNTNSFDVWVGGNSEFPGREFDGLLDDVRIYDEALTPAEVAALAGRSGGDGDWIVTGHDMYAGVLGNVGIGVSQLQADAKLQVAGRASFAVRPDSMIHLSTPGGWPGVIAFTPNGHRRDIIFDDTSMRLLVSPNAGAAPVANGILIDENGSVAIGWTRTEGYKLLVNGSAAKPGGGSWSTFSDQRLKDVEAQYEHGLTEVAALHPVQYRYRQGNALELPADQDYVGIVAQEVQKVIPEAVQADEQGYLTVNNDPILWAMVNAIKELKAQNEQLQQRIAALETAQKAETAQPPRHATPADTAVPSF